MSPITTSNAAAKADLPFGILDMFSGIVPAWRMPQVMPNITEFAEHPDFCGKTLYPRQATLLKVLFLEDENFCADEDTEILTRRGWLRFNEVVAGEDVMTISPNSGQAEWSPAERVNVFQKKRRTMIHMQGKAHSSLTTPDHRWLSNHTSNANSSERSLSFVQTQNLSALDSIPCCAPVSNLPADQSFDDDFVELVAWYWTEGHLVKGFKRGVVISQSERVNPHHTSRIRDCLTRMFGHANDWFDYRNEDAAWVERRHGDMVSFALNYPASVGMLLVTQPDTKALLPDFVSSLTFEQLNLLIDVSIMADGHERILASGKRSRRISQSEPSRLDAFQMACSLAGIRTVLRKDKVGGTGKYADRDRFTLSLYEERNGFIPRRANNTRGFINEEVEYSGHVWCPTTKNGTWLARRHGTVYFTGNTDYDHHVIEDWINQAKKFESGADCKIPLDIYERIAINKAQGRTHFREFLDVGGRRGGKGYIGGITMAYLTYRMLMLDDPQAYYGVDKSKDLYVNIVATSTSQARKYLYADVASTITGCTALLPFIWKVQEEELRIQTPADVRKYYELRHKGVRINKDVASIRITANSSTGAAGRGGAAFAQAFDEFAHLLETESSRSASEVYEAYTPSLAQMGNEAFIYVPSSPFTRVGKFAELVDAAYEMDDEGKSLYPEMFCLTHPSWALYEDWDYDSRQHRALISYDHDMQKKEQRNPAKFKVEYRGRFAETVDAYLDSEIVDRMFAPHVTIKEDGEREERNFVQQSSGQWNRLYRFHCDPSKAHANFAVAGGHLEMFPDGFNHAIIDFIRVYQPKDFPPDPVTKIPWVDYTKIENDLVDLAKRFPMSDLTFDQFSCVDGDSIVMSPKGLLYLKEAVGDISVGDVSSVDGLMVQSSDGVYQVSKACHTGESECLEFKTKHGISLRCTPEHRVLVQRAKDKPWSKENDFEWMCASEIREGDRLHVKVGGCGVEQRLDITEQHPNNMVRGRSRQAGVGRHSDRYWIAYTPASKESPRRSLGLFKKMEDAEECAREWYGQNHKESVKMPETLDEPLARYMGLMIAEGNVDSHSATLGNKDIEVLQSAVDDLAVTFGREFSYSYNHHRKNYSKGRHLKGLTQDASEFGVVRVYDLLARFLGNLGIKQVKSQEKVIPWSIRVSPQDVQGAFLRGYFEGDGGVTIHDRAGEWVTCFTTSRVLSIEVQQMLLSMGILSTLWEGSYEYKGEIRPNWRVKISGRDLLSFREKVGFISQRKTCLLDEACERVLKRGDKAGLRDKNIRGDGWYFDRIVSIQDAGSLDTYDIVVPESESFAANGVICHNSTGSIQKIRSKVAKQGAANPSMQVREITFTATENWRRCEQFKTAAYMGWVHMPVVLVDYPGAGLINLASTELKYLQEKNGRVAKQDVGIVTTKDTADVVMVVVTELLREQITNLVSEEFDAQPTVGGAQGGYSRQGSGLLVPQPTLSPTSGATIGAGSFDNLYKGARPRVKS